MRTGRRKAPRFVAAARLPVNHGHATARRTRCSLIAPRAEARLLPIGENLRIDSPGEEPIEGPRRRTLLAAERTWLAWWRTALGTAVAAIGVGAALPKALSVGHAWLYAALGIGYGLVAIALFAVGSLRQARVRDALEHGDYDPLEAWVVTAFSAAGIALAAVTCGLLIVDA